MAEAARFVALKCADSTTCNNGQGSVVPGFMQIEITIVRRKRKAEGGIFVMKSKTLLLPVLCACCLSVFSSEAVSQSNCHTIGSIEKLNKSVFNKRVAHIKGTNTKLFIALDPYWSMPEFDNVPYRHPEDMKMIKKNFAHLMQQEIDEVVVWKFRRPSGMGAAVPFAKGCAVPGYGEPDQLKKLNLMHEALLLISRRGLSDSSVRNNIKRLLMLRPSVESHFNDAMIDIMIDKLRPLLANASPVAE